MKRPGVLDDSMWESAVKLKLPDEARDDLVEIISGFRNMVRLHEPTGKERERLKKLCKIFAGASRAIDDPLANSILWRALLAGKERSLLTLSPNEIDEVGKVQDAIRGWRDWLARAESEWRSVKSPPLLLMVVAELNDLLKRYNLPPLVRSSEPPKGRGGRADDCHNFLDAVTERIFGRLRKSTIDYAIQEGGKRWRAHLRDRNRDVGKSR